MSMTQEELVKLKLKAETDLIKAEAELVREQTRALVVERQLLTENKD